MSPRTRLLPFVLAASLATGALVWLPLSPASGASPGSKPSVSRGEMAANASPAHSASPRINAAAKATPKNQMPRIPDRKPRRNLPTFVVAAMGDSFGSGEGAPESPNGKYWQWSTAQPGSTDYKSDNQCHRSRWAGSSQAIALLQNTFKNRVNIVFKNFACSGASIRYSISSLSGSLDTSNEGGGILTPYEGMSPEIVQASYPVQPPQLSQVDAWRGGKPLDAVLLNIGGNDSGFARMLSLCGVFEYLLGGDLLFPDCASRTDTPGAWDVSSFTRVVWDRFDGPTRFNFIQGEQLAKGEASDAEVGCTSLTPGDAASGVCTPILDASYHLLAQALRGETPTTYVPCSVAESDAADKKAPPNAPIGYPVSLSRDVTCIKGSNGSWGMSFWAKAAKTYPKISARNAVKRVYINTYPGPVTDSNGNYCDNDPSDPVFKYVDSDEAQFIDEGFLAKLNGRVAANARVNSTSTTPWTVINVNSGYGHGYCAQPQDRWINSNTDAIKTMAPMLKDVWPGDWIIPADLTGISSGFAHPNSTGFKEMYRTQIASQLRTQICAQITLDRCPNLTDGRPLPAPATVAGKITSASGQPLAGVRVDLSNSWDDVLQSATTGTDGRYSFSNLPPSVRGREVTVTITATPLATGPSSSYLPSTEYFDPVDGEDRVLNLTLNQGASVTGKAATEAGSGIAGVRVEVWAPPSAYFYSGGTPSTVPSLVAETRTDANGNFVMGGLRAGDYKIHFVSDDTAVPHYRSEWHPDSDTYDLASVVKLELNRSVDTGVATLTEGPDTGTITGTVFDEDEYAAEDVRIVAYSSTGQPIARTQSDENGAFELKGVPSGQIRLNFTAGTGDTYGYYGLLDQWYSGRRSMATADVIALAPEQELDLGNLTLLGGSRLSVGVYDEGTYKPMQATITVTDVGGNSWTARTNPRGEAVVTGLPRGTYTVLATPAAPFMQEWFDKRSSLTDADTVTLGNHEEESVEFYLQKAPKEIDVQTNRLDDGSVELTWDATFGTAQYQVQRQSPTNEKKWTTVYQGFALTHTDAGAKAAAFEDSACYRARGLSPFGRWGAFGSFSCA